MIDPKRNVKLTTIAEYPHDDYIDPGQTFVDQVNYPDHLMFACPGCGRFGAIRCTKPKQSDTWEIVLGSLADPTTLTLSPSIHCIGCCGWHGYLKSGLFEVC